MFIVGPKEALDVVGVQIGNVWKAGTWTGPRAGKAPFVQRISDLAYDAEKIFNLDKESETLNNATLVKGTCQ